MSDETNEAINIYKLFSRDNESAENGKWFWIVPKKMGFKLRAFGAEAVTDLRDKLLAPYENMARAGVEIPKETREEIGLKVLANAVIVDWKGITNKAGEDVAYSGDEAYLILKDLEQLADFVIRQSNDQQQFKDAVREEVAGN